MALPILADGIKAVALATTPEALSATSQGAHWVMVGAHEDNTQPCTLGASTVVHAADSTQRGLLVPQVTGDTREPLFIRGPVDLKDIYVDVQVNTESVYFVYLPFGA